MERWEEHPGYSPSTIAAEIAGLVPEQAWEDPDVPASAYAADPTTTSIGFANGKPAGSASPLIWAQAQYLRLVADLASGSLIDQPAITTGRYVKDGPPAARG